MSSAPRHLSKESRAFWRAVHRDFDLEEHDERTLLVALEAFDRMCEAKAIIDAEGLIVRDRFDQRRAHPACAIERDARVAYLRAMRELGLADSAPPDVRPRRMGGAR